LPHEDCISFSYTDTSSYRNKVIILFYQCLHLCHRFIFTISRKKCTEKTIDYDDTIASIIYNKLFLCLVSRYSLFQILVVLQYYITILFILQYKHFKNNRYPMGSRSISQLLKIYRATCKRPSEFEEDEEKIYEKKERLKLL
jgi:uncharacterized membrane protein YjdF